VNSLSFPVFHINQSRWISTVDRVIPTVPIEVRVATGGVYRVALEPAGGAGVIRTSADMVETRVRKAVPLIAIRPVPSERLRDQMLRYRQRHIPTALPLHLQHHTAASYQHPQA